MDCPHCETEIDDALLAKHLAAKGGRLSRRSLSPADKLKMQAARHKHAYLTPDQLLEFFKPEAVQGMGKTTIDGQEAVLFMEVYSHFISKFPVMDEETYLLASGDVLPRIYKVAKKNNQFAK